MRRVVISRATVVLLAAITAASAASPRIISGDLAQRRVTALTSNVHWFDSLDDAKAAARHTGKLILWVHMLGELNGDS